MVTSEKEKVKICPFCSNEVDPLRAAAVSIVDGKIAYFCSADCRETYLMRNLDADASTSTSPLSAGDKSPSAKHDANKDRVTDGEIPPDDIEAGARAPRELSVDHPDVSQRNRVAPKAKLARLMTPHLVEAGVLLLILIGNVPIHFAWANDRVLLWTTVGGIAFSLFWRLWRERGNGVAISVNSLSVPLAALLMWGIAVTGSASAFTITTISLAILIVRCGGRIAELSFRRYSGVADLFGSGSMNLSVKEWRDNSSFALRVRKVAAVMNWGRIPVSLSVGLFMYLGHHISLTASIMTTVILLITLDSRLLRMITGDAHLKVAMLVKRMGGNIRDANAVSQLGAVKVALMNASDVLTMSDLKVVDWQLCEGAHLESVLAALCEVESAVKNRFSEAIVRYCSEQGAGQGNATDVKLDSGQGISGETSHGLLHCGTREFMLAHGIATGIGEPGAHGLEDSGRRAFFVALNRSLVAVFGIDEQIRNGVEAAIQRLSMMNIEPVMMTSANMASAHGLGARIGIQRVVMIGERRDESDKRGLENLLAEFRESDVPALFMGSGGDFEQNVRHAACAVAAGEADGSASLADVDMRGRSLADIVMVIEWAIAARRSVRINFFFSLLLFSLGICFAIGWNSVWMALGLSVAAVAISVGCTLSGPYPAIRRNFDAFTGRVRSFFQRTGLIKRNHN